MEYMTQSQIAALIIGIVFSVISVATTILTIKNADKLNTFAKAISASIIAPFIAFVGWLFLIFSFIDGFRNDETLTLIIAILLSIVIAGMVIIVSKALYNKHQADYEDEKEGEEESENESAQEDDAQNADAKEPLMIAGPASEQENTQEGTAVKSDTQEVENEEIAEEPQAEESAETESESTDASEVEQDENIEQASEEQTEEQGETEEASEVETDEIAAVEAPQEKNAIASVDEKDDTSVDELNNEEPQEDTQKKELTQEEQDDLEFEKFLESLGKKSSSEDNDDNE